MLAVIPVTTVLSVTSDGITQCSNTSDYMQWYHAVMPVNTCSDDASEYSDAKTITLWWIKAYRLYMQYEYDYMDTINMRQNGFRYMILG